MFVRKRDGNSGKHPEDDEVFRLMRAQSFSYWHVVEQKGKNCHGPSEYLNHRHFAHKKRDVKVLLVFTYNFCGPSEVAFENVQEAQSHRACLRIVVLEKMQLLIVRILAFLVLTGATASRIGRGVAHRTGLRGQQQNCILLSKEYHSSKLEQTWLKNARRWSDDFCSHMHAFSKETSSWLETIAALDRSGSSVAINRDIFSSFVTTYDCNGDIVEKKTWIEPLSHGLRHPRALCGGGADTVDRDYMLLASRDDILSPAPRRHERRGGYQRRSQNIYMDLGASTWNIGPGGPSQSWFYDSYKRHGIEFDRFLLWEAQPTAPHEIFSELPKELWHKYQFFNWPASSNSSDASSPLHILKKIARPEDFVVLKLDIDKPDVEMEIIQELIKDRQLIELVDEFFFEYHVLFAPMNKDWFGSEKPSPLPTTDTLDDSYRLFHFLRKKGVRAHSWV